MVITKNKKAWIFNSIVIHIVLIAVIYAFFFYANAQKINARGVKQQIIEQQTALLIDAAVPGMSFELSKLNLYGIIEKVELKDGSIHVFIDGLPSPQGYPYFSHYQVSVEEKEDKFVVNIHE